MTLSTEIPIWDQSDSFCSEQGGRKRWHCTNSRPSREIRTILEIIATSLVIVLTCVKLKKIKRLIVSISVYISVCMSMYLAHQDFILWSLFGETQTFNR